MEMEKGIKEAMFSHVVLEGTSYEVGRQQAELLKSNPGYLHFITNPIEGLPVRTRQEIDDSIQFFDRYCPGLNDEIRGFADAVGVPAESIMYYALTHPGKGQCSHFAVLPHATSDEHMRVGRSYEWNMQDDFRLCTTRIKGFAAHLGFSLLLFGRIDGMNEHGLSATMSAGTPGINPQVEGCLFWAVIRTVLDRCQNVDEAIELVRNIPISFNFNLLLADKSGEAALMEIANVNRAVKRIAAGSREKFIHATNHYVLPEMLPYDQARMWNSVLRYRAIESRLSAALPDIGPEVMRGILTDLMEEGGVCGHHVSEGFGTLWSILFDLTAGKAEICMGSPQVNPWRSFGLNDPMGMTVYPAKLPDEPSDPAMWRRLEPEAWE